MVRGPRIFLGMYDVAGYLSRLNQGFRRRGLYSRFLNLNQDPYRYAGQADFVRVTSLHRRWHTIEKQSRSRIVRWAAKGIRFLIKLGLLVWALLVFDAFVFGSLTSFFQFRELPLLRFFRKKVIFIFLGTDSRPTYISGNTLMEQARGEAWPDQELAWCVEDCARKKRLIRRVERWADYCINHPASAQFHEKPFVLWFAVGYPLDCLPPAGGVSSGSETAGVTIVHAPSKRESKRSTAIRELIDKLRAQGLQVEFVEVSGRPNQEVLDVLRTCDFVVDELYSDVPMGVLGAEAASFGKPTVNGGYYGDCLSDDYPPELIPPAAYCLPEEVVQMVERLIRDRRFCSDLGARAQAFTERQWNCDAVAEHYLALIRGEVPAEWWYDPQRITYVHGYGLDQAAAQTVVARYIRSFGKEALFLADKPELERRFLEFAGIQ